MRRFGTLNFRIELFAGFLLVASLVICEVGVSQNETSAATTALTADAKLRARELEVDPKNVQARVELAIALERKKDFEGVVSTLSSHKDKIGRSGLILLARAYANLKMLNEDVATLELANARSPKDAQLQMLLGQAISRAGKKDLAIETLYKAKATNPKYVPAYDALLAELVKGESRQEARDLISDMVKKFKMQPRWASELCHLFVLDAFHAKAVETCGRAMKIDPANPMNAVYLANSYREQDQPDKAKNVLIRTASRIRKSEPVQTALGDYFYEKKNFVDAYKWYKMAAKTEPKSYAAQLGLAQAALELQKMEDSMAAFVAACTLKRGAIREFQSGLIKIRNRGDGKWQSRFEEAIANNCQLHN